MKLVTPIPVLAEMWPWTADLPVTVVMLLGDYRYKAERSLYRTNH